MTPPLVIERPKLRLRSGNGLAILSAAIRAADKAGWSLTEWRAFSRKARALEWEEMFALVCHCFEVSCLPTFSKDPQNWRSEQTNPMDDEGTDE